MTTGDEEAESLVDNLFRDVDDQFKDLEREYSQAREEIVAADSERQVPIDPLEASNERYELLSQVATLQADVSRQADELDERDRVLAELGDKIAGFQSDIAERDEMLGDLHHAKQAVLDERREQARLQALLDARAAERQELADVAQRLQHERDHVQELLTQSLARFDEADAIRVQLDDKVRHLEAARDTAASEHDARAHELIESRAEMSKLTDQLAELTRAAAAADERAERADALAERRTNEAGYLNRRIDAMAEKLDTASGFESDATELRRELNLSERRIAELERQTDTLQSELEAANAAVEAIASRTSDYDELVVQVSDLTQERDAAWEAASGYVAAPPARESVPESVAPSVAAPAEVEQAPADEVTELADRARELGARRANEAQAAAQAAEVAAAEMAATHPAELAVDEEPAATPAPVVTAPVDPAPVDPVLVEAVLEAASQVDEPELHDLDDVDLDVIDADLAIIEPDIDLAPADQPPAESDAVEVEGTEGPEVAEAAEPAADLEEQPADSPSDAEIRDTSELFIADIAAAGAMSTPSPPAPAPVAAPAPPATPAAPLVPVPEVDPNFNADAIPRVSLEHLEAASAVSAALPASPSSPAPPPFAATSESRQRTILPADLVPNTVEAVTFLLNQPGVTAIVDARSTCGRTGIRPSELFERIAALRDYFDVPVEVVVTPVSTPVGGAPDLPAIGVHHVTGADTVADRIRALCMGFPADQPLVVVAGDDHVRRAAISEEANVVEPSAVLNLSADRAMADDAASTETVADTAATNDTSGG